MLLLGTGGRLVGEAKRRDGKIGGITTKEIVGRLFNAPNTALGLGYGSIGQAAGDVAYELGLQAARPRITSRGGRTEFLNNPFGGLSAITIGDATTYKGNPYVRGGGWDNYRAVYGQDIQDHEYQHVLQGRQLGPLYLPSNVLGGFLAVAKGQGWHGDANWNERGPNSNPPRPWPPRVRK